MDNKISDRNAGRQQAANDAGHDPGVARDRAGAGSRSPGLADTWTLTEFAYSLNLSKTAALRRVLRLIGANLVAIVDHTVAPNAETRYRFVDGLDVAKAMGDDVHDPMRPAASVGENVESGGGDRVEIAPRTAGTGAITDTRRDHGEKTLSFFDCACGGREFFKFGPYTDTDEPGLRWLYTCTSCGEQIRLYQTSDAWRHRQELIRNMLRRQRGV